jgi:hypothetical protein
MSRFQVFIYICVCCVCVPTLYSQSTSPWLKIGAPSTGLAVAPAIGEGYMTVSVKAAAAYTNSNWWTSFVEKNRQAVLTANLTGTIANVPVAQTITSNAVQLQKNRSMVDLGFAGVLVDHLPTTFSGMNVTIQINKTAQDGLQGLISQVSQLASAQPQVLAISPETMQITSFAKSVADFLFHANLLVMQAQTKSPFPASGALDPGLYVCFAGDSEAEYSQYLQHPDQLKWSGAQLTFSGAPLSGVSFFIIEVDYAATFFAKPLDSLSFGASKPWVTLMLTAEAEIPGINTAAQASTDVNDIQSHLWDARTLLLQDYSFINDERDAINAAVYAKLNGEYVARLNAIGVIAASAPPAPPVQPAAPVVADNARAVPPPVSPVVAPVVVQPPPVRRVLLVPGPATAASHAAIISNLGVGKFMTPTF